MDSIHDGNGIGIADRLELAQRYDTILIDRPRTRGQLALEPREGEGDAQREGGDNEKRDREPDAE